MGHKIQPRVYWSVAVVGLVGACYRAWSAEHEARLPAERESSLRAQQEKIETDRKRQVERLTEFIDQGQKLIQRCRSEKELVPEVDATNWAAGAERLIAEVFGSTYISRFKSAVGMPMHAAHWPNLENRHVDGYVYVRVYRLQEFIDELRLK